MQTGGEDEKPIVPPLDKIPTNEFIEKFLDEDGESLSGRPLNLLGDDRSYKEDVKDVFRPLRPKIQVEPLPDENDDLETILDDKGMSFAQHL